MKIAVEGCAHGQLERIYDSIALIEQKQGTKVDLLICCGDFQSTRNLDDLQCMAVPKKFHDMCSFYKYYSGEKLAPILTIFIGGNHEASNYLQELSYGGWVAPNIYYLGNAGVINVAGIRIGGISGIYKGHDFNRGHYEIPPYTESAKRSVYHVRNLEVFRLKQLTGPIDIFISHDWPRGVYNYGDVNQLLRHKPHFREDIECDRLGSRPCEELLYHLKPRYWFSAHLHTKFSALIHHDKKDTTDEINGKQSDTTKFLALDKCLPYRRFLQILDFESDLEKEISIEYDLEWLTILHLTNHLMSVKDNMIFMPGKGCPRRWVYTPTAEERELVFNKLSRNLKVPLNFVQTATPYKPGDSPNKHQKQPIAQVNAQTLTLCNVLNIDDPLALLLLYNKANHRTNTSTYDTNSSCTDVSTDCVNSSLDNSIKQEVLRKTDNSEEILLEETLDEVINEIKIDTMKNKVQRISLCLPSPKGISAVNEAIEISNDLDNSVVDLKKDETVSVLSTDSPNSARKFKRRNQEMYSNAADEVC